ncbi:hypothetical protein FRC00_004036 [Tulasnella sp. 408]|nr:hypothetical protein FRC00_004036 [Tulasnella sp. 408]
MTSWKVTGGATHAALAVEELQELIFRQLLVFHDDGRLSNAQDDLANLAATCRAFSEVALNVRWRNANFHQLIQVWNARGVIARRDMSRRGSPEMGFARAITLEDWQRFEYYARRIHHMQLEYLPDTIRFSTDFATAVLERTILPRFQVEGVSPLPIFPKLNSLEFMFCTAKSEVCVCMAVINESPCLDRFVAHVITSYTDLPSDAWTALLATLGNRGRPLKYLAVLPDMDGLGTTHIIGPKTHSLAQLIVRSTLQELALPSDVIPIRIILNAISYLPTLKKLQLGYCDSFTVDYETPVPQNAFSSLECLEGGSAAVRSLLVIPKLPSLAKLVIRDGRSYTVGSGPLSWPFVREMIGVISRSCPALEILHLQTMLYSEEETDILTTGRPATSVFVQLQACPSLKDVRFDFSGTSFDHPGSLEEELNLSDDQWEQLAVAWPDLKSIWFSAGSSYHEGRHDEWAVWAPRPRATLRTTASFFRHCPELFCCGVSVLARGEEARAAMKDVLPRQEPTRLDFRGSWADKKDAQGIAIFLASLVSYQDSDMKIPQLLSSYQVDPELPHTVVEFERRQDWQEIKQLVDSTRITRQA